MEVELSDKKKKKTYEEKFVSNLIFQIGFVAVFLILVFVIYPYFR